MSAFVVCAALAGFALLYSLWVPREEVLIPQPPTPLDHLREKKKVIYDNLKDLNFEYRTGKLSDEDYQQLKASLQYEMAVLMKSIEELEAGPAAKGKSVGTPQAAVPEPAPAPQRQAGGPRREAAVPQREAGVCAACGHVNPPSHKHCSECGARLAMVLAAVLILMVMGAPAAFAERVTIEGVAQNGTTGRPAAGLAVSVIRAGENMEPVGRTATDLQGRFRFEGIEQPAPPSMLLVQAEQSGVRYTEPVTGSGSGTARINLKVYESGAPASAIRISERAVIFQPRGGKLLVNELYMIRNESSPPATYAAPGGTFRFFVPEAGRQSVQASAQGASGMPLPIAPKPAVAEAPGIFVVSHALKPGENRIEVSFHLDYPGSLTFESQAVDKVERTRLAVAQGVTVVGEGVRFMATEPQMKFSIYDIANNDRWSVKLTGEARGEPAAASSGAASEGGGSEGDSSITRMPGAVAQKLYLVLVSVLLALGVGFTRLWRQEKPALAAGTAAGDAAAGNSAAKAASGKHAPAKAATRKRGA